MIRRINILFFTLFWVYVCTLVLISINPKGGLQDVIIFDKEFRVDYLLHALAFMVLPILVFLATKNRLWNKTGFILLGISLLLAVGTEFMQLLVSGRTFNPFDITSNIAGIAIGILIAIIAAKYNNRNRS